MMAVYFSLTVKQTTIHLWLGMNPPTIRIIVNKIKVGAAHHTVIHAEPR